jgi:Tol biopolymer transport system component
MILRPLVALIFLVILRQFAAAAPPETPFSGRIVFFGSEQGDSSLIQTMSPDGADLQTVLKLDGGVTSGRVAPGGQRLAFGFQPKGANAPQVWVLGENGLRNKVADRGFVTAWSPDAKKVTYHWRRQQGDWESFSVEVATGEMQRLPVPKGDIVQDWSPDGRQLAVIAGNPTRTFQHDTKGVYPLRQIYLVDLDGTRRRLLTPDSMQDAIWPRFSPDAMRIAHYQRKYPGRSQSPIESLVVQKPDGNDLKILLTFAKLSDEQISVRPLGFPAWSPDGRSLVWLADRRRRDRRDLAPGHRIEFELVFVRVDNGEVREHPFKQTGIKRWGEIDWR